MKTPGTLGNAVVRPWVPDVSVWGIFIMLILKVRQQVCQNLWSGIIQGMSDCDTLLLYINMAGPLKGLQSKWLRQANTALV